MKESTKKFNAWFNVEHLGTVIWKGVLTKPQLRDCLKPAFEAGMKESVSEANQDMLDDFIRELEDLKYKYGNRSPMIVSDLDSSIAAMQARYKKDS